jgi:hypothetical protein
VDINGDGLPDIVGFAGSGVQTSLDAVNSGTTWPDLVSSVTSGLGATTTITYQPLTKSGVYTKDTGDRVPLVDLIAPTYVVSRVDTSNGVGGTYGTTYSYAGAKADLSGRGFLGFRQTSTTDLQTNVVATTTARQDYPYIGLTVSATKTLGAVTLNTTNNAYGYTALGGSRYQVVLTQSQVSSADLDGSPLPTVTSSYQYDAFGNATQVVVSATDGQSKTTVNTYTNDTVNWLLGRLTGATVTSQLTDPGPPPVLQTTLVANPHRLATHDFDGDGKSDVAWLDTSGNAAVWLMNGAPQAPPGAVGGPPYLGTQPTTWSVVGQRDFDGDGKHDWLWRDTAGNVAIWFIDGAQLRQSASVGTVPTTWSIVGTGDFNGDGKGDILWHDTSGNVAIWFMNGAQVTSATGVGNAPPTVWSIVGTGDFNGDGMSDILWQDTSGNLAMWFMNGAQITQAVGAGNVPTSTWKMVGTGDFNGDGMSDILWQDTSGNVVVWLMSGAQVLQSANVGTVSTTWSLAETGDYNGDGKSDVLWRDSSGNVTVWFMNGTQLSQSAGVGNAPTVWSIQGVNVD